VTGRYGLGDNLGGYEDANIISLKQFLVLASQPTEQPLPSPKKKDMKQQIQKLHSVRNDKEKNSGQVRKQLNVGRQRNFWRVP